MPTRNDPPTDDSSSDSSDERNQLSVDYGQDDGTYDSEYDGSVQDLEDIDVQRKEGSVYKADPMDYDDEYSEHDIRKLKPKRFDELISKINPLISKIESKIPDKVKEKIPRQLKKKKTQLRILYGLIAFIVFVLIIALPVKHSKKRKNDDANKSPDTNQIEFNEADDVYLTDDSLSQSQTMEPTYTGTYWTGTLSPAYWNPHWNQNYWGGYGQGQWQQNQNHTQNGNHTTWQGQGPEPWWWGMTAAPTVWSSSSTLAPTDENGFIVGSDADAEEQEVAVPEGETSQGDLEPEPEPEPEQEPEQEPEPEPEPTPLVQTQTEEDILKEAEEEAIAEMTGEAPTEEEEEEEEILEYDDDWRNIYKSGGTSAPIQWTATITWAPTETPPEPVETEDNVQAELENAEIALSKAQAEVQELEEKVEEITHNSPTASPTKTWSPTTTYAPSDTFSPTDTFNPTNTYGPTETEDRRRLEEETTAEKNSNNATEMFDDEEPLDIEGEKEFQAAVSEVRAMFWRENHRRKLGQRQWQHRRRLHSLMQEAMF